MNRPLKYSYMKAAQKEITTLEEMGCWEEVDGKPWMNVLPSTWAFQMKVFPSALVCKLKGRFCAHGDRQIASIDYLSMFAPVVNWTMVHLLLMLSVQLALATKQVGYTSAFVHVDIDKPPDFDQLTPEEQEQSGVYVKMPRGFVKPGKVLKLKKSLLGLKQSPHNFFHCLKSKLEAMGFEQALDVNPCLFISDKVICLMCVDKALLFARDMKDINNMLQRLTLEQGMGLEFEDDVTGFVGAHIECNVDTGEITFLQQDLIECILEALGLRDPPAVDTPPDNVLRRDEDGDPPLSAFSCTSVVGVLWYFCGQC
jgi:hypothetical protein